MGLFFWQQKNYISHYLQSLKFFIGFPNTYLSYQSNSVGEGPNGLSRWWHVLFNTTYVSAQLASQVMHYLLILVLYQ